jgi:hypothetical protein
MLNLRAALKQTQTKSVLGLRSALSSQRSSVTELLQTNIIHQHYLNVGGRNGPFGFPTSNVQFLGAKVRREFRGGEIQILGDKIQDLPKLEVSVRFLGFRCVRESTSDQLSPLDEPYFIISVDTGNGAPAVKKFGRFEGVDSGTEIGVAELLIQKVAPNPMAIRVVAYENDHGDPDETAKKIQDEVIKLSQQAGSLASAAAAADGPGIGPAAAAGTVGGIAAGPIGALIAAGIVSVLGLGDDFINQAATLLFARPEDVGTPPTIGQFRGIDFNRKINVNGGDEGEYDLFFDILVLKIDPGKTVGG